MPQKLSLLTAEVNIHDETSQVRLSNSRVKRRTLMLNEHRQRSKRHQRTAREWCDDTIYTVERFRTSDNAASPDLCPENETVGEVRRTVHVSARCIDLRRAENDRIRREWRQGSRHPVTDRCERVGPWGLRVLSEGPQNYQPTRHLHFSESRQVAAVKLRCKLPERFWEL